MTLRGNFIPECALALFLDVDGTLLEIAASPGEVKVPASVRNTLDLAAEGENGALALVSGRTLGELDRLFAPITFPAAGQHGLERRDASGRLWRAKSEPRLLQPVREALSELVARHPGLLFEDKGMTLALHYRLAPRLEALVREVMNNALARLPPHYQLKGGKCVVELMPAGYSKRSAIESFMREPPFAGRTPVFVGDDLTDEDGFAAVNALGGYSIRVGGAGTSLARYQFSNVSAVIAWLRERNLSGKKRLRQ